MTSKPQSTYEFDSPCEIAEGDMNAREDGWFCDHCQKTVVDASKMTQAQFDALLERSDGDLCASLLYDEDGDPVFASPEQRRWLQQLAGVGKLIATASIPPLLLAGCLESQPADVASAEANAPTAVEQQLQEQEKVAASRLAEFHIKPEDKKSAREGVERVNLEDALSGLNEMQRRRNARHGLPEHPSDAVISEPLAPGEKMKIDMEKHNALNELEVIQAQRKKARFRGRMRIRKHRKNRKNQGILLEIDE